MQRFELCVFHNRCFHEIPVDENVSDYELIHGDDIQLESPITTLPNLPRVSSFVGPEESQLVDDYQPTELFMLAHRRSSGCVDVSSTDDVLTNSLGKCLTAAVPLDHRPLFLAMNSFQSEAILRMKEGRALTKGIHMPSSNLPAKLQDSEERRKQLSKVGVMANECIELVKRNRLQNEMEFRSDPSSLCSTFNVIPIKKRRVRSNPREWRILYHSLTKDQCIEYFKYHRWKEPVTNAPKGTGCRVSQCAIHAGCNHLLKMR